MSDSESDEINRREVAYRLFAAEFEDANYSYAESDEERAPNYVVTPTGARVNRMFVVGVLTEVEQVSDDVVRARVVDPTGAFVIYAGQYQPEALAALESADAPSFVAVTGKARTFQPDDADVIYTSIRPEEVSEVDAETRDRWAVATAEQTVDRVSTMAAAHERVERGENLQRVLEDAGVQPGLAAGIPLALDHYGTTPDYLDAVRELALDAARVVAGDLDEAGELSLSPGDGGDTTLPYAADLDVEAAASTADDAAAAGGGPGDVDEAVAGDAEADRADDGSAETEAEMSGDATAAEADEPTDEKAAEATRDTGEGEVTAESESDATVDDEAESEAGEEAAVDGSPAAETPDPGDVAEEAAPTDAEAAGDDEMYELSEEERQEVKENYDVEFSSGTDIPESPDDEAEAAGESTEDEADAADESTEDEAESSVESVGDEAEDELGDFDADDEAFDESQADADSTTEFTEDEYDEPESDREDAEAGDPDLDLEDYVVDLMDSLDDGDGALRDDVVATAADDLDADEGEVEDAIQDALMSGRCYESGDDHLKAI
jgi:RPA family protein